MIGDAAEWQHMCAGCSDARLGEWRWDTDRDARASGADGALPLAATDDDDAADDATTDALIAELPSPPRAITEVPPRPRGVGAAPPRQQPAPALVPMVSMQPPPPRAPQPPPQHPPAPPSTGVRYLTHDEERKELGKPLWTAVRSTCPRPCLFFGYLWLTDRDFFWGDISF